MAKQNEVLYLVILPDKTEYWVSTPDGAVKAATIAVHESTLRTSRKNPEVVNVSVYTMKPVSGTLTRGLCSTHQITPLFRELTEDEYEEELRECLLLLPKQFHKFVTLQAYERGHSSGYSAILGIAHELEAELRPCIDEYHRVITKSYER